MIACPAGTRGIKNELRVIVSDMIDKNSQSDTRQLSKVQHDRELTRYDGKVDYHIPKQAFFSFKLCFHTQTHCGKSS